MIPYGQAIPTLKGLVKRETDECVLWPGGTDNNGYGVLQIPGANRTDRAHRLVCIWVHGDPPANRPHVAHACGNPQCVNQRHLRWASVKENHADRIGHGTHTRGEKSGTAKLTEADVHAIRRSAAAGEVHRAIATKFDVRQQTVSRIVRRESWAWLD